MPRRSVTLPLPQISSSIKSYCSQSASTVSRRARSSTLPEASTLSFASPSTRSARRKMAPRSSSSFARGAPGARCVGAAILTPGSGVSCAGTRRGRGRRRSRRRRRCAFHRTFDLARKLQLGIRQVAFRRARGRRERRANGRDQQGQRKGAGFHECSHNQFAKMKHSSPTLGAKPDVSVSVGTLVRWNFVLA